MNPISRLLPAAIAAALLAGCASLNSAAPADLVAAATPAPAGDPAVAAATIRHTVHRDGDDLLSAGLGEAGLRAATPPAFADAQAPTAQELRRRAIWSNWRGIADLSPGSAYGRDYGSFAAVPGEEFQAFVELPGRAQPHRVLVQLPDAFDPAKPCVVVTASSGSRGIYGAIALAGAWGLPRGCAVAHTDKGTGTGYVDAADGIGTGLDGRRAATGEPVEFAPTGGDGIRVKHAHSGDNPEADWGRHVRQAAAFAQRVLRERYGDALAADATVIAVGVSNGGGAVLRAAELDGDWLDGVVAISPNVLAGNGGRALYDYSTEAAIWLPCALNASAYDGLALVRPGGAPAPAGALRCAALAASGEISESEPAAQAEAARRHLRERGWTDAAIAAADLSTAFDLWRSVNVTYAAAYSRSGDEPMPCGYGFTTVDAAGKPTAATAAMRAAWWSDASGIPPGAGVGIVDGLAGGEDPLLPGLRCLRQLWDAGDAALIAGIDGTRAALPAAGRPVLVVHGLDDGLIPAAFSGGAYANWAGGAGREVVYWPVAGAQHFDAFVALPFWTGRYQPLLPVAYRALDAMWARIADGEALPPAAQNGAGHGKDGAGHG
ncbi:3-hydroxybutyrate oligomer hydrolase family protein [Arenimonas composti]|uniref:Hydrogenase n=1 Tax=Arenimonas composti TR7-09 = DSM 18010 TaxID=1121013 RepID=A0A091BDI2_9GAMM|nr:3-hydroxybutyrate oligomer hydrolase family protein [Arenimonas composti]KFN49806.1 hypothetical protein P873_09630 [Arenimonas composti TR7-09 = DSM 18010]